jgi:hypothetical protein
MRLATRKRLDKAMQLSIPATLLLVIGVGLFLGNRAQRKTVQQAQAVEARVSGVSCEIPDRLIAMKPALQDQWSVIVMDTEEVFRSSELCTAVKEAAERLKHLERVGALKKKSR